MMININEAKESLLKDVNTPSGDMKLYGINLLPGADGFGLIFYVDNKQKIFWNMDCSAIHAVTETIEALKKKITFVRDELNRIQEKWDKAVELDADLDDLQFNEVFMMRAEKLNEALLLLNKLITIA